MCFKKIYIILLLIAISTLPLYSQAGTTNGSESTDLDEMKRAIENQRITQVNELTSQNKLAEIDSLFSSDEEAYFTLVKENDVQYASFIREMMFKAYRNVSSLQDDLLFIDCKKAIYAKDWDMTSLKANDLIRRYPNSNRKDITIRYWKLALFKSGKDQEFVNLVEQYPEFDSASQKFQYGQSLYNIGRIDDSQKYMEEATTDSNYALRATATLGLIALAKGNDEEAALIFDFLEQNFTVDTPYYDFVLLSKARLFSHFGVPETAITYYQAYSQMNDDAIDEVTYEIALTHRKAGNLEKAKRYFEYLLGSKFADEYYVQTLYNLVLIDQETNEGQSASQLMADYQSRVDDYFDNLLQNRNLMNEVKTLRNNFLMENDDSRKNILLEQIRAKEEQILVNQANLEEKISFLDPKSVQLIKSLELSFIERTEAYFVELDLIDKYRNRPKDQLIAITDRDRNSKEEVYLLDITGDLLEDIPNVNDDQFLRAYWYANQIYLKKKYIVNLSSFVEKTKSNPQKNAELRKLLNDEQENLDEIQVKAKFDLAEFPNLEEKQELAEQKVEEFLAQENKLEKQRQKVIDTYYEVVADKNQKRVVDKFKDLDKNISVYANSFSKFNNIKNDQQLYVDYIALDLEFRKVRDSYNSRKNQLDEEGNALSEAELNTFTEQQENLYRRINNFVFRNNNFEYNYQLYFNLAEISNFIYSNNYTLIYNHYQKVLELNPDFPQKDVVQYNLAYYKNRILDLEIASLREEKMKDRNYFYNPRPIEVIKTTERYSEVIKNYLDLGKNMNSKYQVESLLRLAELYYDIAVDAEDTEKYIQYSIKLYNQIYVLGNQDEKYEALFQRAWHKMAINKYFEAINDLELLLSNKDIFNEDQRDKYRNADEIIAYSLDAIDNLDGQEIKSYDFVANSLYQKFDEETANTVFHKVLNKKRTTDDYEVIIKLYDAQTKIDPYKITNPLYSDSIIVTLSYYGVELGDSLSIRGEREYRKAVEKYGYGSDWYEYNKNQDLAPYVKVVQTGLDDFIMPDLYSEIQSNPTLENINRFSEATERYASYVGFDEEKRVERLKLYDTNRISTIDKYVRLNPDTTSYSMGINEIYGFIERNPNTEKRRDLEQNAYNWASNIIVITDTTSFDSLQYTEEDIENLKNERRTNYINIANRYYNYLVESDIPNKDDTIHSLLFYRGLTKYKMGDNEGAKEDFLACDDLNISDEFKEVIFRNLAEIYKANGNLDTSIEYYAKAQEFVDAEMKLEYEKEIYSARTIKYNKLYISENQEDKIKAAQETDIMLKSNIISDQEKEALRKNAIALYAAGGDYDTAIARLIEEGDKKTGIDDAWKNYSAAFAIADSLGNTAKASEIEDIFMTRFPNDSQTFKILLTRLDAVQDSTKSTYNPILASEKLIEIYERATKPGDKLDISSLNKTPEDYYFQAIIIKTSVLSKEEQVKEWIAFNNKFPDYERIAILGTICQLYEELGMDEEYLDYIKILYATDNTNYRYPKYAIDNLMKIDENIVKAYRKKNWASMLSYIEEYKATAQVFTNNGIPAESIAIPTSLTRYDNFTNDYEREQEKKALLAELDKKFNSFMEFITVPADADDRIKVNSATTWNGNLYGENKRINNFDKLANKQFELIDSDVEKVNNSDLLNADEIRDQVYLLDFAKFKIAQYSGDLIFKQITKYLDMPEGQYNAYQNTIYAREDLSFEEQDDILNKYAYDIKATRENYVFNYDTISIGYAKVIYEAYINGKTTPQPRSDEVMTFLAKVGASEAVAKDEKNVAFDSSWRRDFSAITERVINDGFRDFMVYSIPGGDSLILETTINCPISPLEARIRFVDEGQFFLNKDIDMKIKINDKELNYQDTYMVDGVIDDSLSIFPYLYRGLVNDNNLLSLNYQKGNNKLSITVVNKSYANTNIGFNFAVIYDQEKLFIHNNSIMVSVVTDNTWLGADSLQVLDITDPNWNAVSYGNIKEDYYQLDAFKNSMAIPVWYENLETVTNDIAELTDSLTNVLAEVTLDSLNLSDSLKITVNEFGDTLFAVNEDSITVVENEPIDEPVVKYFIKEFDISGKVIESMLYFLADESANIFLNGEQIGYDEYYYFAPPDAPYLDISPDYFVQGKNVLIFEVLSPTKKNGLLIDLQVRTLNERR